MKKEVLGRDKASADDKFRAQNAGLKQLEDMFFSKVQAQARRTAAVASDKIQESEAEFTQLVET